MKQIRTSKWITSGVSAILLSTATFTMVHAEDSTSKSVYTIGENVGLGGYDPVSYFPEGGGKAEKGFVLRNYTYKGITYRFASDANLAKFKQNPVKYLPAY